MKFFLAFVLGLCVLTAQTEARSETFDGIVKFLEGLVQHGVDGVKNLVTKFETTFTNMQTKLKDLVDHAQDKSVQTISDIIAKVDDLVGKGGAYKKCVEQYRSQFEPIVDTVKAELKQCGEQAFTDLHKINDDVQKLNQEIHEQVGKLEAIVAECRKESNIIKSIGCLKDKSAEIKQDLSTILSDAKDAIITANNDAAKILINANHCSTAAVTKAKDAAEKLYQTILQCAKEGQ